MPSLAAVQPLLDLGLVVVPANRKHPFFDDWQSIDTPAAAAELWEQQPKRSAPQAALVVAPSGLCVLDLDTEDAAALWRSAIPKDVAGAAPQSYTGPAPDMKSGRGLHLWFRRPPTLPVKDRSGQDWTLRTFGVIIVPPSVHMQQQGNTWKRTGVEYEWHRPLPATLDAIPEFPLGSCAPLLDKATAHTASTPYARPTPLNANGLPSLQDLIDHPPLPGSRDSTVIATMGRFARLVWPRLEYARTEVTRVADALDDPDFTAADYLDRFERAWAYEDAKRTDISRQFGIVLDPERCETHLLVSSKDDDTERPEVWLPWVITDARCHRSPTSDEHWQIDVRTLRGSRVAEFTVPVPSRAFGARPDLERALAARGCSILTPGRPARGPLVEPRHRLKMMLERWWPETWLSLPPGLWSKTELERMGIPTGLRHLFLTGDQVLGPDGELIPTHTTDGEVALPVVSTTPRVRFPLEGPRDAALQAWQQLLTFHFPEVVAPLAALTALLPLKPLFIRSAFFPFVALTGQAGSGKSKGFLPLLVAASGMAEGTGRITAAGAKRMMGESRAGWLWIDDIEDPGRLAEILRQVTDERTMRQAADSMSKAMNEFPLLQMPIISGETLGSLEGERALEERVVRVEVPGMVKNRASLVDPSRPQWDDIEAWASTWHDGLGIAGHLVAAALHATSGVDLVKAARALGSSSDSSDRLAQKEGVLQLGVRLATFLARGCPDDELHAWHLHTYRLPIAASGPHSEVNLITTLEDTRADRLEHDDQGKVKRPSANAVRVVVDYLAQLNDFDRAWVLPRQVGESPAEHLRTTPVKVRLTADRRPIVFVYLPGLLAWANDRYNRSSAIAKRVVSKANWDAELRERGWASAEQVNSSFGARMWRATEEDTVQILRACDFEFPKEVAMLPLPEPSTSALPIPEFDEFA